MKVGDLIRTKDKTDVAVGLIVRTDVIQGYDGNYTQYWTHWDDGTIAWVLGSEAEVVSEGR